MATILVVEDRPEIQTLLRAVIGRAGHDVRMAGSATEAMRLVEEAPQLIFADLGLPDRSGIELAGELRRTPQTSRVPIVIITAHPDAQKHVDNSALTGVEVLAKPFRFETLDGIIRKHLGSAAK